MNRSIAARESYWTISSNTGIDEQDLAHFSERIDQLSRIQFWQRTDADAKINKGVLSSLRTRFFNTHPHIPFRVYGGTDLDLSFLEELPMLERLSISVSDSIHNPQFLLGLTRLKHLDLELPKVVQPDILRHIPASVVGLTVAPQGKKQMLDLEPVAGRKQLMALTLVEYDKGLSAMLPTLSGLRKLHLRSIGARKDLDAIEALSELRSVTLQLGSTYELGALAKLPKLRYLQLWRIAKLTSADFIGQLRWLEYLFLETLNSVSRFPETRDLSKLRLVKLAAMKGLRDFATLEQAPALEEFVFQKADHQRPEDFLPVLRNKTIQRAGFGFGRKADVTAMKTIADQHGVDCEVYPYPEIRSSFDHERELFN